MKFCLPSNCVSARTKKKKRFIMLCLSGFEQYSRWVPLTHVQRTVTPAYKMVFTVLCFQSSKIKN